MMMNRCPRFVHHHHHRQLLVTTRRTKSRSTTTALVFIISSSSCNLLLSLFLLVMGVKTQHHHSHNPTEYFPLRCTHSNSEYAWSSSFEAFPLWARDGPGLVMLNKPQRQKSDTTVEYHCLDRPDTAKLIVRQAVSHDNPFFDACVISRRVISRLFSSRSIDETTRLRFIIGFGGRLWYGNDYGTFQVTNEVVKELNFNPLFVHPEIEQWVKRYLRSRYIQAIGLVATTDNTPSFPSFLVALEDSTLVRILKYQPVVWNSEDISLEERAKPITLGYVPFAINAMYLPEAHYSEKMTAFLFFRNYYSLVTVNLGAGPAANDQEDRQRERTLIPTFPILPAQGFIGCPVHLCWWPVLDDMFYHEGIYYFVQGRWLWTTLERSENYFYSLMVKHALDMHERAKIDFTVNAVFYDYNLKAMMLIRSCSKGVIDGKYHVEPFEVVVDRNGEAIAMQYKRVGKFAVQLEVSVDNPVISATMMDEGKEEGSLERQLWVVIKKVKSGATFLRSYSLQKVDNTNYKYSKSFEADNFPFPGLTAFFYHHRLGHLFILTGFYLYIFQEADLRGRKLDTSLCTAVEFQQFINCSGYFSATKMNGHDDHHHEEGGGGGLGSHTRHEEAFTTKEAFSKDARTHHRGTVGGKFLPGQCNFVARLDNWNSINFTEKIVEPDDVSPKVSLLLVLGVAAVVIFAAAIFFVACLLCCLRGGGGGRGFGGRRSSGGKRRLAQEAKLKQYLQGQMSTRAISVRVGGGGGKSPAGKTTTPQSSGNNSSRSYSSTSKSTSSITGKKSPKGRKQRTPGKGGKVVPSRR